MVICQLLEVLRRCVQVIGRWIGGHRDRVVGTTDAEALVYDISRLKDVAEARDSDHFVTEHLNAGAIPPDARRTESYT